MNSPAPTFSDIQRLLFTLADAFDPNIRIGIYGRHNPSGGYSWETQDALLNSVVVAPPRPDTPLVAKLDYGNMTDDEIKSACRLVFMLASKAMPLLKPGTNRRYATDAEIAMIIAWLKTLPPPMSETINP